MEKKRKEENEMKIEAAFLKEDFKKNKNLLLNSSRIEGDFVFGECILTKDEIHFPSLFLGMEPIYFQMEIGIPKNMFAVGITNNGKYIFPKKENGGKLLRINEGGASVGYNSKKLIVNFFTVRREGTRYFLVNYNLYKLKIPFFPFLLNGEQLNDYLSFNRIPDPIKKWVMKWNELEKLGESFYEDFIQFF